MRLLFQKIKERMEMGKDCVLVSTISSSGSTPRGAGAHMLVDENGRVCGTVGGGAIEGKSIQLAMKSLSNKIYTARHFSLNDIKDEELGMVCGGDVTIFFQYMSGQDEEKRKMVKAAQCLFEAGKKTWFIVNLSEGKSAFYSEGTLVGSQIPQEVLEQLDIRPQILEVQGKQFYTELMIRNGNVYIFGGGHVAQALVPVLEAIDFRCIVVEDREEFCNPELFPKAEAVRLLHPNQLERELEVVDEDYICIMTRGHKSDLECQVFALKTDACYIGVIGSRRKIAATREKLIERGFSEKDLERITTPIGLSIGAQTPAEIAISIAAQLIEHRAKRMN